MATKKKRRVKSYTHKGEERPNNPQVGLVTHKTDPDEGQNKVHKHRKDWHEGEHDSGLSPSLQWAGKAEGFSFDVPTVSLHVHEQIDPRTIIEAVRKENGDDNGAAKQIPLFESPLQNLPLRQEIEFYGHEHDWSNRMIAGDSLLVMKSLIRKEGMGGNVQMVYIDPPYGIKYRSNFQPFTDGQNVRDDRDENLTREPEMIKAFRDTWELGIHSYLSYLRDRLNLSRELLSESGSCFVQIGSENIHLVAAVMDEVFESENRVAVISYATTGSSSAKTLPEVANYLLWYAKDKQQVKYRQLYESLTRAEVIEHFDWHVMVEFADGEVRKPTPEERFNPDKYLPKDARIYRRMPLNSQGVSTTGRSEPYEWNGRTFHCAQGSQWSVSMDGMDRLAELGRLEALEGQDSLRWKQYENEVPGRYINNIWAAPASPQAKRYVVQTAPKVVQRCMLMTTDPGDLVFDPTCGSGTTARVAEQWGRRWITCDTSRVAVAIARQWLMTSHFDYYTLAHPEEGVGSGLQYESVAKVSAAILAYDEKPAPTILYDQPIKNKAKVRVSGPFTVEAVSAPLARSISEIIEEMEEGKTKDEATGDAIARGGETSRQGRWRDELAETGICGKGKQRLTFTRLEPLAAMRALHAEGEIRTSKGKTPERVVVAFGSQYAPMDARQVSLAIEEASSLAPPPKFVVFAAFHFDPEAAKDIDETKWEGVTLLRADMSKDLLIEDLKKKAKGSDSFWLIGQPDVRLKSVKDGWQVTVEGFDYFNDATNVPESGDKKDIAMWMLDTDYDGRSLYPRQVFFPAGNSKHDWTPLAKNLKAEIDMEKIQAYGGTKSLPFTAGRHKRVAVKIIDRRGIESLKIIHLEK